MQTLAGPGAGPRAALDRATVVAAYQADALTVGYGADIVAPTPSGFVVVADLTPDLAGGTVKRDCLATMHGGCTLAISRDLAWGAVRVRPWMTLAGAGTTVRWNLGVYLLTTPDTTPGLTPRTVAAVGYDGLWFLNQPVTTSISYAAGSLVLDAVRAVITSAPGAGTVVLLDGTAASKTLPNDKVWPLTESSQPTYLQVVNDLLATVAYRGVWADEEGAYRSEPYVSPAARAVEWAHTVADPRTSLVSQDRTRTLDTFSTPNQWRFVRKGLAARPAASDGSDGLYVITNQSSGLTSVDARGFTLPKTVFVDAADAASLVALGQQLAAADRLTTAIYKVKTAPMPGVGHFDRYSFRDDDLGGQLQVQAQSWALELDGADMTQTWQDVAA